LKRLASKLSAAFLLVSLQTAVYAAVCFGAIEDKSSNSPGLGDPTEKPFTGVSSGDTFLAIVKIIFFLIVIIGLFLLIMKVISSKKNILFGRAIRSLGGVPLGQNKSIQVVEIGNHLYIVGVGDNVQLLEKIQDEAEVAQIIEAMTATPQIAATSLETISGLLKRLRNKPEVLEETDVTLSFQQVFHSKMQRVSDRKKLAEEMLTQDQYTERLNDK
jgi:flagellar protein FliO/FliZ